MTPTEIAWWLRRLPGLADAPDQPLMDLAQHWEPLVIAGRTFLVEGQASDGLYMLVEGQVEVVRGGPDGNPVMVGMVEPPDLLGFAGVLTHHHAIASTRARGRIVLLRMPEERAREVLLRDDAVSAVLRRALLVALARRLAKANRMFARLSSQAQATASDTPLLV